MQPYKPIFRARSERHRPIQVCMPDCSTVLISSTTTGLCSRSTDRRFHHHTALNALHYALAPRVDRRQVSGRRHQEKRPAALAGQKACGKIHQAEIISKSQKSGEYFVSSCRLSNSSIEARSAHITFPAQGAIVKLRLPLEVPGCPLSLSDSANMSV